MPPDSGVRASQVGHGRGTGSRQRGMLVRVDRHGKGLQERTLHNYRKAERTVADAALQKPGPNDASRDGAYIHDSRKISPRPEGVWHPSSDRRNAPYGASRHYRARDFAPAAVGVVAATWNASPGGDGVGRRQGIRAGVPGSSGDLGARLTSRVVFGSFVCEPHPNPSANPSVAHAADGSILTTKLHFRSKGCSLVPDNPTDPPRLGASPHCLDRPEGLLPAKSMDGSNRLVSS